MKAKRQSERWRFFVCLRRSALSCVVFSDRDIYPHADGFSVSQLSVSVCCCFHFMSLWKIQYFHWFLFYISYEESAEGSGKYKLFYNKYVKEYGLPSTSIPNDNYNTLDWVRKYHHVMRSPKTELQLELRIRPIPTPFHHDVSVTFHLMLMTNQESNQ